MRRKRRREESSITRPRTFAKTSGGQHPTSVFSTGFLSRKFLRLIGAFALARKFDLIPGNRAFEQQHDRISAGVKTHLERDVTARDLSIRDVDTALRA